MLIRDCTDQVIRCVARPNSRVRDWELIDQGLSESEIGLMEGTTVSFWQICKLAVRSRLRGKGTKYVTCLLFSTGPDIKHRVHACIPG